MDLFARRGWKIEAITGSLLKRMNDQKSLPDPASEQQTVIAAYALFRHDSTFSEAKRVIIEALETPSSAEFTIAYLANAPILDPDFIDAVRRFDPKGFNMGTPYFDAERTQKNAEAKAQFLKAADTLEVDKCLARTLLGKQPR